MEISTWGKNGEEKTKIKCVLFYSIFGSSGGKQMLPPERFQQSAFSRQQNILQATLKNGWLPVLPAAGEQDIKT